MSLEKLELDKVVQQYSISELRNIPEYVKLCEAHAVGLNNIQDAVDYLTDMIDIDKAEGVWLDYIGWLVGINRNYGDISKFFSVNAEDINEEKYFWFDNQTISSESSLDDEFFRKQIKAKILFNKTRCTRNENIRIIKGMFNADKVVISKPKIFDNFTVVGSPTITDDGIASGFSGSNYINTGYEINTSNFEIRCKVKFNTQSIINAVASDGTNNTFIFTRRNNGILGLSYLASSDNSWKQINTSIAIDNDKWNYCIFGAKNGKIYFYHSYTSFEDVTLIGEQANTISGTYDKTVWISTNYDHSRYIEGSIDLKQFSITVDGKEVYRPYREVPMQLDITLYGDNIIYTVAIRGSIENILGGGVGVRNLDIEPLSAI